MVRADRDLWTRTVGWLKVLLPLGALVILSLTFLLARNINPEDAIPYAEVDVEERLREPRMTAPVYSGTTDDGASLRVTGDEARPEDPATGQGATGRTVFGTLETPDGARTDLAARMAEMDLSQQSVLFSGDVLLRHAQGYSVQSDEMVARLDRTDVRSLGPVVAEGPPGQITADEMVLTQDASRPDGYVLVFNGSVKLIYQPER
ncbi:MAG: export transporter periplasmic protein LptC [Pseudomonadota bacterium]